MSPSPTKHPSQSFTAEGYRGDGAMGRPRSPSPDTLHGSLRACAMLLALALLTACGDFSGGEDPAPDPLAGSGAAPSGVSEAEQIQFFTQTLWPVLNGYTCGDCHTIAGARPFPFADPDTALAYRTLVNNAKVNFGTPSASRVYVQLAANAHHCWSGDCQADASQVLAAIDAWITMIEDAGGSSTGGEIVTQGTLVSGEVDATDGVEDTGGVRFTRNMIAFWRFDEKVGTVAADTSGVAPAMDIDLGQDTAFMDAYGIDFAAGTASASRAASRKLYDHIAHPDSGTGQYSIEMWFTPANTNQQSDVLRHSGDVRVRQRLYQYDVRTRSTAPGIPNGGSVAQLVTYDQDRDLRAGLQHMVLTYDRFNGMRVYVNGVFTDDVDPFPGGQLWNWSSDSRLTLGSSGDNGWFGQIRMLTIYKQALAPAQIRQNFEAGVGLRLTLSFDISQFAGPGSRIEMSVSQLDDQTYLLCQPTIVTDNIGMRVRGIRVKVNGTESSVGQAFSRLNAIVTSNRQQLSNHCTIVENLPGPETFQLAFEGLGQWADPVPDQTWSPITYDYTNVPTLPTHGVRDFARVNETMSVITNVPVDVPSVETTYGELRQQLPGAPDLRTFVSSHQVGITKLALEYCIELVNDPVERDLFFDQGPVFEWNATPAMAFMNDATEDKRLRVTGPLVDKMMGVGLSVQPAPNVVEGRLLTLIDALVADCGACDAQATQNIVKGTCAAMLASGTVQMH